MSHLSSRVVVVEPDGGASGLARDDDVVFKALADATRRDLLDALYAADGQTLGQLAARHPHLTRFGVMKHLAVLEDAGLVVAEKVGREKRHYLNPVPIAQIAGRWISRYARPFTAALVGLKVGLEAPASDPPHPRPSTHDEESR